MTATVNRQHGFLQTNGLHLHYVRQGQGPLMLFLHGFPEFWYSWRHQLDHFAAQYTCVALDLRGYNDSDKPPGVDAYRLDVLVEDVRGAIAALGYDRAVLVGHDWGGAIAWAFAYAHPELLQSLIVMNIPHPAKFAEGLRHPQQLLRSWYIGAFQLPLLPELLLQAGDYWLIEQMLQGMAIDKSTFSAADLQAYKTAAAKPGALTAMVNYYRALSFSGPQWRPWGILEVPTLLIWGEADAALGKELSVGTEDYVRHLRLRYIPQCSHWVQQERPLQVNALMDEFLALEP
ncbi:MULTISPECIES: alpha/beta hydrolase [Cyanophyceae]|uniref:alpha/beta fold hydrolase n=1 Tax=Cyanophyceae TaxID=3028117 RepID=UPI001685A044|nr:MULTISPECIES: alpha/beta hydrolase [Cyanophyceae]MBD1918741.1 alpha/beta hydrolase [Phormidium sp. FACHB-77]MBD2033394.1 alpha/beta hydrolase [Phormidium sp. FACHB-322]MBD2053893.1 alpha/beta hydrolase [Leptolyngbya sp. FACHB-60]